MRALAKLIAVNDPDLVLFVGEALVGNEAVDQVPVVVVIVVVAVAASASGSEANPTTTIYNASIVKSFNATHT
jgi:hypothetical protein